MLVPVILTSLLAISVSGIGDKETELANSNTAFGFNLLNVIQDAEGGNVFVSPFSISSALAMTYVGAGGETAKEIAQGLQISEYTDALDRFKALNTHLFNDHNKYALRQANRLYGDKEVAFKNDYLKDVKKYFEASLSKVDFQLEATRWDINAWVEEQTDQKIKDLLQKGDLDGAVLVLINAIYFRALWKQPFKAGDTSTSEFSMSSSQTVEVDMMSQKALFRVGTMPGLSAKILEMDYMGGEVSMFVILPDEVDGLCAVQESLTVEKLGAAIAGMEEKMVHLVLPKFEINDKIQLSTYLKALGMEKMFTTQADFSKIADVELMVSEVIHKSFVRVDENGTEAAAATAVVIVRTSLIITDEEFLVNRPFIFFIREKASGSVLFMGRVVDPTDKEELTGSDYKCKVLRVGYSMEQTAPTGVASLPALSLYTIILAFISKFI